MSSAAIICGTLILLFWGEEKCLFALNNLNNLQLDILMGIFSAFGRGDCIAILLVLLVAIPALRNKRYILSFLLYGIISGGITYLLKDFFNAPRPLMLFTDGKLHTVSWLNNAFSHGFPSGHTVGAFSLFSFLLLIFPSLPKIAPFMFVALAILCGISRIYLAQHFLSDVLCGAWLGILFGLFAFWLSKKFVFKKLLL
jgi:membrane-associated phospholipid phosphatase